MSYIGLLYLISDIRLQLQCIVELRLPRTSYRDPHLHHYDRVCLYYEGLPFEEILMVTEFYICVNIRWQDSKEHRTMSSRKRLMMVKEM